MNKNKLRNQLPILFIIAASLVSVLFDVFKFYSSIDVRTWNYMHEALTLIMIFVYYMYLRKKPIFQETDVKVIIRNFTALLIGLYIFVLLCKLIFSSEFSIGTFPKLPDNISSLFFSNIMALTAILVLIPMLLLIRNLVNYKYKKKTKLYTYVAVIASLFLMIWTTLFEIPPNLNFTFQLDDNFSIYNLMSNILYVVTIGMMFMLALRNSWITYLRRREKTSFFILSAILIWLVIFIFDYAFAQSVPAHSLVLGVFTNLSWIFLMFYSIFAGMNLMMHLPTARVFDRKMNEVSSLHDLSRAISVDADFRSIVRLVIESSSKVLETQFTWLEVYSPNPPSTKIIASNNLNSEEIERLSDMANHPINKQIYNAKKIVVMNEFLKDSPFHHIQTWKSDIGCLVGVPIVGADGKMFGIFYAAKSQNYGFDPDDIKMLEAYANQASIAFENAELVKASMERERMEQELTIAREVQNRLLPQKIPVVENLDIETLTITAYEVGGDYYDFYSQSDDTLGLVIGDVSGKGTSAAFYMAETKGIIQSLARNISSPRDILIQTNGILYPSMERKSFISLLTASWDIKKKTLRFARAGHCPIIHYSATSKKTTQLLPTGMAIGLEKGTLFQKILEEAEYKTGKGDVLAFYTDGLSEARNKNAEEFGEQRLCDLIRENAHLDVGELKQVIIDTILDFLDGQALHDDLTLILLKVN